MRYSIFFLLFFLCNLKLFSAGEATISGQVIDAISGENLISVSVTLLPANDTTKVFRGAYSNKYGFYSLPNLKSGKYILIAKMVAYEKYRLEIDIQENTSKQINIKMKAQAVNLKEVEVTADRDKANTWDLGRVDVDPSYIAKLPAIFGESDVFRALQLLPGVKTASEISSGLYVRGGSPDQNLILLDGVIVYNPSHLGGFLSTFNPDAISSINLIKGAFPAEYGGRLSSVLDMQMKEGTKEDLSGAGGLSLISAKLTLEGPINENSSFMISGRRFYFDLLLALASNEAPDYYFYDLNAKVNYKLGENDHIYLSGYFGRDILKSPDDESVFGINWGNATGNFRWMHILSPTLFTNFSLIVTDYTFASEIEEGNSSQDAGTVFTSSSGIRDYMMRAEAQYFPNEDHTIKTGLEFTYHNFKAMAIFGEDSEFETDLGRSSITSIDGAIYLQDEWKITDDLRANIGGRLYYFESGDYLKAEPRVSLAYSFTPNHTIKAAVAKSHQFLHLIVRNDITLPTDLWFPSTAQTKPGEAWQYVIGYEQKLFDNEFTFSIEGYYKEMKNLYEFREDAQFTFGIPLETQFTSGTGKAYGIELFLQKKIGAFTGWLGYTLSWTKRQFPELNEGKEYYPRYDSRNDISLTTTFALSDKWEIGAAWVFASGQAFTMPTGTYQSSNVIGNQYSWDEDRYRYTERNGARLPANHRLDLNIMYKTTIWDMPGDLYFSVYNVYNQKNPFAWYISKNWENGEKQLKQVTLFPFLPTLGINFKF